jgi:hypothetical protein
MVGRVPTYAPDVADGDPEIDGEIDGDIDGDIDRDSDRDSDRDPGDPGIDWRAILFDRDSFFPVLILAILMILVSPLVDQTEWGFLSHWGYLIVFPISATLVLLSLHRSRVRPRTIRFASAVLIVVGVGTVITSIARQIQLAEDRYLVGITSLMFALLFLIAFPAVVRRAFQHEKVNLNTLAAGITAYLLIGIWFTSLFRAVSAFENYQLFAHVLHPRAGDYNYFSFITLTTVGYGDLTPRSDTARTLAIFEAILGQIFLVTAVARIVSLLGSQQSASLRRVTPRRTFGDDEVGEID